MPLTVLLSDAFRDESEMYADYLESIGIRVRHANDPHDLLDSAKGDVPDAVIVRVALLEFAGDRLTTIIGLQTTPETRRVPVIALTSDCRTDSIQLLRDAHATVLVVPVSPDELATTIRRLVS